VETFFLVGIRDKTLYVRSPAPYGQVEERGLTCGGWYYTVKEEVFVSEMSSKFIVWVCPGNIAPNCAGKVGDVLVSSAVTSYLQNEGWDIHFVTNEIMEKRLRDTYGFHVSNIIQAGSKTVLSQDDVEAARDA